MTLGDVFKHTRAAAHQVGIELRKFVPLRDDPILRIVQLCRAEQIDVMVDVGSNDGSWAEAIRSAGFRGRIVSFEAHPAAAAAARARARQDLDWEVREVAIGSTAGTLTLSMTEASEWSSLLEPASGEFQPTVATATTEVRVERLDAALADVNGRLFLKLDVQGYELEAFRGALGILDRVLAGKAEVLLRRIYQGQPSLTEFIRELEADRFHVVGFEHGYIEETGKERFIDVLFCKSGVVDLSVTRNPRFQCDSSQ